MYGGMNMIEKMSYWSPKRLDNLYVLVENVFWVTVILSTLLIFSPFLVMIEVLFRVGIGSIYLKYFINYIYDSILVPPFQAILILFILIFILFFLQASIKKAINISMLRDVTLSKFKGPFGFVEEKFYLPETSKWRSEIYPSKIEYRKNAFRELKVTKNEFNENERRNKNYYHSPFYSKKGRVFEPRLTLEAQRILSNEGITLRATEEIKNE